MSRWRELATAALIVVATLWLGCDEGPLAPRSGTLEVAVYDQGDAERPVPDVDIEVTPVGRHQTTGDDGKATFQLTPGGYYVDASVCCIGSGLIDHHKPVTITAGKTTAVTLNACLACVQVAAAPAVLRRTGR